MAGIALVPGVYGSSISVQDSTALANYPVQGITLGTVVYNVAVAAPFILQLSTANLVTDQVIAVNGVSGARWIKVTLTTGPGSSVQSVTGPAVNNTDPANPVISVAATGATAGLIPADVMAFQYHVGPALGDADATLTPETDKAGSYVLAAGVTTANRNYTFSAAGVPANSFTVLVVIHPQTHTVNIKNSGGTTILGLAPNTQTVIASIFVTAGNFQLGATTYGYN
jgi:hypothetical protein